MLGGEAVVPVVRRGVGGHRDDRGARPVARPFVQIVRVASKPSMIGIIRSICTMSKRQSRIRSTTSPGRSR